MCSVGWIIGFKVHGDVIFAHGAIEVSELFQGVAKAIVSVGVVLVMPDGLEHFHARALPFPGNQKGNPQLTMEIGVFRVQVHGLTKSRDGFVQLRLRTQLDRLLYQSP